MKYDAKPLGINKPPHPFDSVDSKLGKGLSLKSKCQESIKTNNTERNTALRYISETFSSILYVAF